MHINDAKLRYGLRVALTPWLVFTLGLIVGWKLSFVGAVFTSLFILGSKAVSTQYAVGLIISSYLYMVSAWFVSAALRGYPAATLLFVFVVVVLSYYILVARKDILTAVMALLGALLIPLQMKTSPDIAWDLAIWLPNNLVIAWCFCWVMFRIFPAEDNDDKPSPAADQYDLSRRWLRMSVAFLPFVAYSFITDNVTAFTLTYLSVQLTQFAASPDNSKDMIKGAMVGNIAGGVMAVLVYEIAVIAPFLPLLSLSLLVGYALLSQQLLKGNALAPTAMTAFTVVCGVSLGPIMSEAESKIITRLFQIAGSLGYIFIAMLVVDKIWPEGKVELGKSDSNTEC